MDEKTLFFFDRWPELIPLYQQAEEFLLAAFPETEIRVQKTQISFYDGCLYACVYLPERKLPGRPRTYLGFAIGLGRKAEGPRFSAVSNPYPGRWTHHMPLFSPDDLDTEWQCLLKEAHDFSLQKRKKIAP